MLTKLHYSDIYRPYTLGEKKMVKFDKMKKNYQIKLNKANNENVINYMRNISDNMNSLKVKINNLNKEFATIETSLKYENEENTLEIITEDINKFAKSYNEAKEKLNSSGHTISDYIIRLEEEIISITENKKNTGLSIVDSYLKFDNTNLRDNIMSGNRDTVKDLEILFNTLKEETVEVFKLSLSSHMNFRDFKYYFNYRLEHNYESSTTIIETGLLLEEVI